MVEITGESRAGERVAISGLARLRRRAPAVLVRETASPPPTARDAAAGAASSAEVRIDPAPAGIGSARAPPESCRTPHPLRRCAREARRDLHSPSGLRDHAGRPVRGAGRDVLSRPRRRPVPERRFSDHQRDLDPEGRSVEEVETRVTKPIEEAVNQIEGIDELVSVTKEGTSRVLVQFVLERDNAEAAQDVRDKVATTLAKLAPDMDPPVVVKFDSTRPRSCGSPSPAERDPRELTEIARQEDQGGHRDALGVAAR
jgi:hypothetical protein